MFRVVLRGIRRRDGRRFNLRLKADSDCLSFKRPDLAVSRSACPSEEPGAEGDAGWLPGEPTEQVEQDRQFGTKEDHSAVQHRETVHKKG